MIVKMAPKVCDGKYKVIFIRIQTSEAAIRLDDGISIFLFATATVAAQALRTGIIDSRPDFLGCLMAFRKLGYTEM